MTELLDATPDSFPERLFLANLRTATPDRRALRALLKAEGLLGLAFGQELMRLRASSDPLVTAFAQAEAADVLVHCLREALDLIGERFDKIPGRRRPHYSPNQRFRILQLKHLLGLTQEQTARLFRVSLGTIGDWEVTVGSTVMPVPPVRRYNDTVHHLAQTLARLGFGGYKAIVQHLARAGWVIGKTTVRRYLKGPQIPDPVLEAPETPKRAVKARHPHHTWHLDLTQIHAFLRTAIFHLATILDSFSRMPLVWQLFDKAPSANQMATFLDQSVSACGKPKYLIVDKGGEFTGEAFREMADAYRVKLRYCSAENHRVNSRLERFWRSLKRLLRVVPATALGRPDLERDVYRALVYYAYCRPHQGLGGATPAEVYHNLTPAHCHAVRPPRGRRGDPPVPPPTTVDFLDGDRRFPFLREAA